jgi:Gpi18-like mannosyltransferase
MTRKSLLVPGIILSVIIHLICVPNTSFDYKWAFGPWYDFITLHGGFSALKYNFADYTPAYLYWLTIAATLLSGWPKILAIKMLAMVIDYVCGFFIYKLVRLKYPEGRLPIFAFLAVILSPTVIYNSALWGQSDSIYTTGLVACIYFFCIRKEIPALISFGVAISFKLQAIFIAPVLLFLWLRRRIAWYYFPLIPLVYVISVLPAAIAGRPLPELLLIYLHQADEYKRLTWHAPNIYQWIPNNLYNIAFPAGLILTTVCIFWLGYRLYKHKLELTQDRLINLATISVLFMPYFLPKMHERYFYPADIFSIIFAFYFPQYFWVAIVTQMTSLFSYLGTTIFIKLFSIPLAFTIWFVVRHCDLIYPQLKVRKN